MKVKVYKTNRKVARSLHMLLPRRNRLVDVSIASQDSPLVTDIAKHRYGLKDRLRALKKAINKGIHKARSVYDYRRG